MDLYLDDPNGLPKFAQAFVRLSENPDDWQAEIINELFRQAPYSGDFEPRLVMNELDPERRYASGAIELSSRTSVNQRDDNTPAEIQGRKRVVVPVIVKDGKMFPLDVFLHNKKAQPLTEARLRRAMFRPELFEATGKRPGDKDMMNVLYPPYRSGGFGLGGNARVGSHETAKMGCALLDEIHPTISQADITAVEDRMNDDPTLRAALLGNESTGQWLAKLASPRQKVTGKDLLKLAMQQIPPKVIQIQKADGGFMIKTANPNTLLPESNLIDRPTAEKTVGHDLVRQVEQDGTVTVSTDAVVKDSLADARIKTVTEFGEYKVKTADGKELIGWVFPRCVDLDGTNTALAIFSNGSQSAMQENIAGSPVGQGTNLIDEKPNGFGCFYLARQGGATAIIPVKIKAGMQGQSEDQGFLVETIMGEEVTLKLVPGLGKIAKIGGGVYGIPADCGWMPLRNMTNLAEDADQYSKTVEAAAAVTDQVDVMFDGSVYSLRGRNAEKLASVQEVQFVNHDQAMFDLAVLGVDPTLAKEKLAEAREFSRWVPVSTKPVTLASERYHKAKTAAVHKLSKLPQVKSLLLKEAAALDDPLSVDSVLSIGFLNPENIGTFISYLPEFEDTLNKLSEMLVAARLGLATVDAGALERVVKHLDKVIVGLRELAQQPQA